MNSTRTATTAPTGRRVFAVIIGSLMVGLVGFASGQAVASPDAPPATLTACATEDAAGPCRWDASTQGNGIGRSFTVDADGAVTFVSGSAAEFGTLPTGESFGISALPIVAP